MSDIPDHTPEEIDSKKSIASDHSTDDTLTAWMTAAGLGEDALSSSVQAVRRIGEFLENTGRLPRPLVLELLADIDLSAGITITQLPANAFVRSDEFEGCWLTDTGMTAEACRNIQVLRRQKIFFSVNPIPVLKAFSRSVNTAWRRDQIFAGVVPHMGPNFPMAPASAGTQYLCVHRHYLRET